MDDSSDHFLASDRRPPPPPPPPPPLPRERVDDLRRRRWMGFRASASRLSRSRGQARLKNLGFPDGRTVVVRKLEWASPVDATASGEPRGGQASRSVTRAVKDLDHDTTAPPDKPPRARAREPRRAAHPLQSTRDDLRGAPWVPHLRGRRRVFHDGFAGRIRPRTSNSARRANCARRRRRVVVNGTGCVHARADARGRLWAMLDERDVPERRGSVEGLS